MNFWVTVVCFAALLSLASCEADFTVCPTSSSISSPSNGAVVFPFVGQTISWNAALLPYTSVTIELWEADQASADDRLAVLSVSTANDGSFSWLPENYVDAAGSDELYIFISEPNYTSLSFSLSGFCFELDVSRIARVTADEVILFSVASSFATEATVELWPTSDPNDVTVQSHAFQQGSEILDTVLVFDSLSPVTSYTYRYRLSYTGDVESDWISTLTITTYASLECDTDVIAAFFSDSAYYDWDTSVPQFDWCGSWETVFVFNAFTDHVFLHRNVQSDLLVVSHRGTEVSGSAAVADWLDNVSPFLISCSGTDDFRSIGCVPDARVSSSFLAAYLDAGADDLIDALTEEAGDGYERIILTGHSQGAGLAVVNLLDVDRADLFTEYSVVTFGSLSVANQAYINQAQGILTYSKRFVQRSGNTTDVVESLGPLGSVHLGAATFVPCFTAPVCHTMPDYTDGVFKANFATVTVTPSADSPVVANPSGNSPSSPDASSASPRTNSFSQSGSSSSGSSMRSSFSSRSSFSGSSGSSGSSSGSSGNDRSDAQSLAVGYLAALSFAALLL